MNLWHFVKTSLIMLISMALVACASTSPTPTDSVSVGSKKKVRELTDMQSMREELARLRDAVEVQNNDLAKLKKRQRELYDDLDYRMRARERVTGAIAAAPARGTQPPAPGPAGATAPAPIPPGPGFSGTPPVPVTPTTPTPPAGPLTAPGQPAQTVVVASAGEQAAYDAAFDLLKQSRYGEAISAFENMIAQYPNGALADDSQYWIGEAWYVTRDFQSALKSFGAVVTGYPESPRVPEALLKVGYIQYELGAKDQARETLNEVVNRFPGSRVAISAQTRLKRLEQEGG